MLLTRLKPPIVKSGGKVENLADEIILAKSALVFYNPENFGSSNGVLDLDACAGYFCIGRLLLLCKFFSLRFLCRLYHSNVTGVVSLVAGILLENTSVREGIQLTGNTLVVHLSLHSEADKENKSCHTGNYGILDGVFLLFAAVVLLLKVRVGWFRDLALGTVMNKFMYDSVAATQVKKSPEGHDIGSRKHPCTVYGVTQHLCQRMYPLAALLLAHVKTCRMIALKRVVLQIYEYEKQPFGNCWKRTVGLDCVGTPSRNLFAFDIMPAEILVVGLGEKRQNFVKKGYADTRECQKRGEIIPCFRIVHPFINVLVSRACA